MAWFGRKAARESVRPVLTRSPLMRAGVDWPRNYEGQLRDAYLGNPVAQRAVKLVSEGVGGAPITASDPALAALVAARSAGQRLMETLAAHLLLHGNAYVQIQTREDGSVAELYALRPERVLEVGYDHMEGRRFRHTAQFKRWRPDRDPESCGYGQLEEPSGYDLAKILSIR